jgi:hypothetical protein
VRLLLPTPSAATLWQHRSSALPENRLPYSP